MPRACEGVLRAYMAALKSQKPKALGLGQKGGKPLTHGGEDKPERGP